jgi:hypothetical protein
MAKKTVCSIALFAVVILLAQYTPAQDYKSAPKPAISDYAVNGAAKAGTHKPIAPGAPAADGTCGNPAGHCLFYGGDFLYDPLSANVANGLSNGTTTLVAGTPYGAATWVPFTVPIGETWNVTGLFANVLSSYGVLDQSPSEPESVATWSINQGIVAGSAGTVIASGTNQATIAPTGRAAFDLTEYTVEVRGQSFTLTPGSYWLSVVPVCSNTANPYCGGVFFLSDVEYINVRPTNAFGPREPTDASYFDSPYFGLSFDPTNGLLGACGGIGCDAFSAGVLGHASE